MRYCCLVVVLFWLAPAGVAQDRYQIYPYPQDDVVLQELDVSYNYTGAFFSPTLITAQLYRNPERGGTADVDAALHAWNQDRLGVQDLWGSIAHSTPGNVTTLSGTPANPTLDLSTVYWEQVFGGHSYGPWEYSYLTPQYATTALSASVDYTGGIWHAAGSSVDYIFTAEDCANGYQADSTYGNQAEIRLEYWNNSLQDWLIFCQDFNTIEPSSSATRSFYGSVDRDWAFKVSGQWFYKFRWHLLPGVNSIVDEQVDTFILQQPN